MRSLCCCNSLGGNSKTYLVANVSAEASEYHETISTLKFASFATKSQQLVTRNQVRLDFFALIDFVLVDFFFEACRVIRSVPLCEAPNIKP